ncbi:MAG: MaoC/PaaZ C-terminal domain-containing protein [Ornithinimicrobium sp.]
MSPIPALEEIDRVPSIGPLILKAAVTSNRYSKISHGRTVPDREVRLSDLPIDVDTLADYTHLMGYSLRNDVPTTFLHVMAFPLQVHLMAARDFPFPMAGMVHVANTMTQHRPVDITEPLTMSVRADRLVPHPKGLTIDLKSRAESQGEVVWEGRSTYLVRGQSLAKERPGRAAQAASAAREAVGPDPGSLGQIAIWRLGADLGRRYAAVAGDVNPIHLNPLAAKAFGFPRAIAHGMWTHARALGSLEGRLGDRHTVAVEFRKPILLPSTVAFRLRQDKVGYAFAVTDRAGEREHMIGVVSEPD